MFIYGDGGSGYEVFDIKGGRTGVFKDDTPFYNKFDGDEFKFNQILDMRRFWIRLSG